VTSLLLADHRTAGRGACSPGTSTDPRLDAWAPSSRAPEPGAAAVDRAPARQELAGLFATQYAPLVRLAGVLLDDPGHREEVVQEAFLRMHDRIGTLRDPACAAAYLRQTVVNLSRSQLRRRLVAARAPVQHQPDARSAEEVTLDRLERSDLHQALRRLPPRQRQAVVLRHCAGLSEAETAAAMGTSTGTVKSSTSRGVAALREAMTQG
jgi:RNA polymerase sigma-70 factor (sigma-E family)